jgi:hypothetical protein
MGYALISVRVHSIIHSMVAGSKIEKEKWILKFSQVEDFQFEVSTLS